MNQTRRTGSNKGFSLLEILIAVGIFASMTVIFLTTVTHFASVNTEDEQLLQTVLLANNKMVELENEIKEDLSRGKFPDDTSKAGSFESPFEDYTWEYTIKKVEIPVIDSGDESAVLASALKNIMKSISEAVREVKLVVTWKDPGDEDNVKKTDLATHIVDLK